MAAMMTWRTLVAPFRLYAVPEEDGSLFEGDEAAGDTEADAADDAGADVVTSGRGRHPAEATPDDEQGDDEQVERPEWLPEQFWDDKKGEARVQQLSKSYAEARTRLNELQNGDKDKPLAEAAEYLADWKVPEVEGVPMERLAHVGPDDVLVKAFAEVAKEEGIGPQKFNRMMATLMGTIASEMPEPVDIEQQRALLGSPEQAKKVAGAVRTWVSGMIDADVAGLSKEEADALLDSVGRNGLALRALAKIRSTSGEEPVPLSVASTEEGGLTPDECYALMGQKDDKGRVLYYVDSAEGRAHRGKVDKAFEQTFGTSRGGRGGRTLPPGM